MIHTIREGTMDWTKDANVNSGGTGESFFINKKFEMGRYFEYLFSTCARICVYII